MNCESSSLLDVEAWTGFSDCFTHRRTGRTCDDRTALLTCVLADGINLGLTRMSETRALVPPPGANAGGWAPFRQASQPPKPPDVNRAGGRALS